MYCLELCRAKRDVLLKTNQNFFSLLQSKCFAVCLFWSIVGSNTHTHTFPCPHSTFSFYLISACDFHSSPFGIFAVPILTCLPYSHHHMRLFVFFSLCSIILCIPSSEIFTIPLLCIHNAVTSYASSLFLLTWHYSVAMSTMQGGSTLNAAFTYKTTEHYACQQENNVLFHLSVMPMNWYALNYIDTLVQLARMPLNHWKINTFPVQNMRWCWHNA